MEENDSIKYDLSIFLLMLIQRWRPEVGNGRDRKTMTTTITLKNSKT